jgi:hypothetical protein
MAFHLPQGRRPRRVDREQLKHDVVLGLAAGLPLSVVARRNGVSQSTVDRLQAADPAFAEEIAAARALGWDSLAAECLEIADDSRNDYVEQFDDDGTPQGWRFNSENVLRSRLRIETRLKLLAKWDNGRYGENKRLTVDGEVQTTHRHVLDPSQLDDTGRAALRHLIEQAQAKGLIAAPEPQDAEFVELSDDDEPA